MASPYLNLRNTLRLFAFAGGALVAGVGCSDKVETQQAVQQPAQQEKVICKAYAEVPIYEIPVQPGDSLGSFNSAYGNFRPKIKVPFEIPASQFREGCYFIDKIGHQGANIFGESQRGIYKLDVDDIVAVANGFSIGEGGLNRRLFHLGRNVKYPNSFGRDVLRVGSVDIELTLSMDDVCGKRSDNLRYQCEQDFKAAVPDPMRKTEFKFMYQP